MMDKRKTYGAIIALIALWIIWRNRASDSITIVQTDNPNGGFYAPYYRDTGWVPETSVLNGTNQPFQSTISVYVDNPAIAGLSNQYIPMFGFVGMTAVSS